jgi:ribosomal-protein-alanine N-acetyltransferase
MPSVHGPIETERLVLRVAAEEDAPAIVRYLTENREHLEPWEPARPEAFYTEAHWREQARKNREEAEQGRSLRLFLFPRDSPGDVIGTVSFGEIVRGSFHACYLGYGLSAAYQGRGYMREALRAAIDHAFRELSLHRIMANYMPRNHRSATTLRVLGFAVEGHARAYLRINGRWEDHILTSLTNSHWTEPG